VDSTICNLALNGVDVGGFGYPYQVGHLALNLLGRPLIIGQIIVIGADVHRAPSAPD
jgi:hypothetical protein